MSCASWYNDYWTGPVACNSKWKTNYVAVVEPPEKTGRVNPVPPPPRRGRISPPD
ncbi:MAG: hypothetical protein RDV41_14815 [Planctomycetota bacterium]|nr:hypothetical protein [Planctomycetota bacterium]